MVKKTQKNLPELHKTVGSLIRVGKENATLLSDIMSICGISDRRQAYQIIEDLIIKYGYPIVASKQGEYKGYFLPANTEEFQEAAATMRTTIESMKKRYNKLIENYKRKGA